MCWLRAILVRPVQGPWDPHTCRADTFSRALPGPGLPKGEEREGEGGRGVPRSRAVWSMYLFQALNSLGQPGEPHVSTPAAKERRKMKEGGGEGWLLTCRSGEAVNAICKWGHHFLVSDFPPQPRAEGSGLRIATRTSANAE